MELSFGRVDLPKLTLEQEDKAIERMKEIIEKEADAGNVSPMVFCVYALNELEARGCDPRIVGIANLILTLFIKREAHLTEPEKLLQFTAFTNLYKNEDSYVLAFVVAFLVASFRDKILPTLPATIEAMGE